MSAAQYDKFETLLDCLDHWATTQPNKVYFTQPFSTEKRWTTPGVKWPTR